MLGTTEPQSCFLRLEEWPSTVLRDFRAVRYFGLDRSMLHHKRR